MGKKRKPSEIDHARRVLVEKSRTYPWRLESGKGDNWHIVWRWFAAREHAEAERERLRRWGEDRGMSGVEYRVMENSLRPRQDEVHGFMSEMSRSRR